MTDDLALYDAASILAQRDPFGMLADVEVLAETGSTNADLMARLGQLQRPVLLVAERQTAGRGRAGRSWHSVPGGVLTFSLAWHFPVAAHTLSGLPLAIGVAVAELLQALDLPVQLKWPNDILRDGKKLAGILVESAADKQGGSWVVAGIGLNLQIPAELEAQIGREIADAPWLARMDKNLLLARLLNALARCLDQFGRDGFAAFAERWNALHAYANQLVQIMEAGQILQQGIALGVDTQGCLLLQTQAGVRTIVAGDVSLRQAGSHA